MTKAEIIEALIEEKEAEIRAVRAYSGALAMSSASETDQHALIGKDVADVACDVAYVQYQLLSREKELIFAVSSLRQEWWRENLPDGGTTMAQYLLQ